MTDGSRIAEGAEAVVERTVFMGREAIVKTRVPKRYRIPQLDSHIQSVRTRGEARLIREARRAGVRTPCIYDVDPVSARMVLEFVEGPTVKEVIDSGSDEALEVCRKVGETVARLHSAGLCHGDLTTSNMIWRSGQVCLIDFSMGSKAELEDIGVDVRLLERSFTSAHAGRADLLDAMMDSYYGHVRDPDAVRRKVEDIRNRGRYT
ncbi:MAG: Kae1-associated serine/threonine protein kinase [Candidatus Methanomethylophilaceae archaeon]|nr:Kae1-associated serine/threonine protein kinase [Candidatus Methanomethylophilaceae archaeon]